MSDWIYIRKGDDRHYIRKQSIDDIGWLECENDDCDERYHYMVRASGLDYHVSREELMDLAYELGVTFVEDVPMPESKAKGIGVVQ
jgi:hypothetical protein